MYCIPCDSSTLTVGTEGMFVAFTSSVDCRGERDVGTPVEEVSIIVKLSTTSLIATMVWLAATTAATITTINEKMTS